MKKLNTILAASALALVASQASAAPYSITGSGANTNDVTTYANTVNVFSGTADLVGNIMTASITQVSNGGFLILEQTRTFDVTTGLGTNEITSCGGSGAGFACGTIPLSTPSPWSGVVSGAYTTQFDFVSGPDLGGNTLTITETINYTASAIPVPAAAWLFGSALVGLAGIGRKRK
jgi:hypothetical protein